MYITGCGSKMFKIISVSRYNTVPLTVLNLVFLVENTLNFSESHSGCMFDQEI